MIGKIIRLDKEHSEHFENFSHVLAQPCYIIIYDTVGDLPSHGMKFYNHFYPLMSNISLFVF